ncbi:DUF3575 domain-containing protein [Pedobacter rhodius]|uniref:DUF3575 domain-containing protein n=1 Tax=Pedobacter rhodius TaxID=3004098 RepID=A0ABT4KVE0_9SPHI|nr:DUF3575 domain-containing protein [Pedobacter sp. SJ11]MCZ4222882.1 DUF3575 domain-containing protein [Pedobacter sp. SJ11]
MRKTFCLILLVLQTIYASAQKQAGISIKSNMLNLVAKGPSFSIEKTIANKYGLELSYSKGELNWGRYYKYNGFLLRAKIYATAIKPNEIIPFYGLYFGNLNKTIVSNANVDNTGFFSIGRNRNFIANSIRSGGNVGFQFIPTKRFLMETTVGLGYGKYLNTEIFNGISAPKSYLDFQLCLSIGYSF